MSTFHRTHYMADGITDPEGLKALNAVLRHARVRYVRVEPVHTHTRKSGYRLRAMYAGGRRCAWLGTSLARIDADSIAAKARAMDPHPEVYARYARALESRERRLRNEALAALADREYDTAASLAKSAGIDARRAERIRREVALTTTREIA